MPRSNTKLLQITQKLKTNKTVKKGKHTHTQKYIYT